MVCAWRGRNNTQYQHTQLPALRVLPPPRGATHPLLLTRTHMKYPTHSTISLRA
jgi:hypothetical protein